MGLKLGSIGAVLGALLGDGAGAVRDVSGVFRVNTEAESKREAEQVTDARKQLGAEFAKARTGVFDRFVDALNRLPRPVMVFGVFALFISAMIDPVWFSERMVGLALVPEPLWWLMGAIVSFYFGARHQVKAQTFQRVMMAGAARAPDVVREIQDLQRLRDPGGGDLGEADPGTDAQLGLAAVAPDENPALLELKGLRKDR